MQSFHSNDLTVSVHMVELIHRINHIHSTTFAHSIVCAWSLVNVGQYTDTYKYHDAFDFSTRERERKNLSFFIFFALLYCCWCNFASNFICNISHEKVLPHRKIERHPSWSSEKGVHAINANDAMHACVSLWFSLSLFLVFRRILSLYYYSCACTVFIVFVAFISQCIFQ